MITNSAVYKYEMPYKYSFGITQCWTNGMVTFQCGAIEIRHNIRHIKLYTYDTNIEDITTKNMYDDVNI